MSGLCVLDHGTDRDSGRAEAVHGLLCRWHRRQLDEHTTEIGHLIVDSMRIRDGGAPREQSPKTRHLKSAEAPAPGDLGIMALYDSRTKANRIKPTPANTFGDPSDPITNVAETIAELVERVAEEGRLTNLPSSLLAQLDTLRKHHEWIAGQGWIDEYAAELQQLRKGLKAAVNDRSHFRIGECDLPITREAPCACYCHANGSATCNIDMGHGGEGVPYCGPHETITETCGGDLLVENGSSVIRCTRCREQWVTAQEHARLAVRLDNVKERA